MMTMIQSLIPAVAPLADELAIANFYNWPGSLDQPWVRMNFVSSVDGGAWGHNVRSSSISTPADRRVFNILRATSDAILVGSGTAKAENYGPPIRTESQRKQREHLYRAEPPVLAVVSGSGNVPRDSLMFSDPANQPIVYSSELAAVTELHKAGYQRILCEGGPHLFTSLIAHGLVNDVCLTIAPLLVGPVANSRAIARIVSGTTEIDSDVALNLRRLAHDADGTLMGVWEVQR